MYRSMRVITKTCTILPFRKSNTVLFVLPNSCCPIWYCSEITLRFVRQPFQADIAKRHRQPRKADVLYFWTVFLPVCVPRFCLSITHVATESELVDLQNSGIGPVSIIPRFLGSVAGAVCSSSGRFVPGFLPTVR